ncbi:MAG: hypothetical protein E7458_03450 [Ruminococcaceae bacterium]|nr:hypothetical protein [Oscillospiraceae bacterium]
MSTRGKLYLALLACLLCFVLLFTTRPSYRPFSELSAAQLSAIELDTGTGVIGRVEDPEMLEAFAEQLSALTISRHSDPSGRELSTLWVMREDGNEFEVILFPAHVIIDGTACAADPAVIQALADLALQGS